jgi:hypothetical protein
VRGGASGGAGIKKRAGVKAAGEQDGGSLIATGGSQRCAAKAATALVLGMVITMTLEWHVRLRKTLSVVRSTGSSVTESPPERL